MRSTRDLAAIAAVAFAPVAELTMLAMLHLRSIGPQTRLPPNAALFQLAFALLGVYAGTVCALLGPDRLRRAHLWLLAGACALLLAARVAGDAGHVRILAIALLPGELAKGALVVGAAVAVAAEGRTRAIGLSFSVVGLLVLACAPDLATAGIVVSAAIAAHFVLEANVFVIAAATGTSLAAFAATLHSYQWARLRAWWTAADRETAGWLATRAHEALCGAGLTGRGHYPPFAEIFEANDLALVDLGARFGWLGVCAVLLAHAGIVVFALHAASRARDRLGASLATASAIVFAWHGVGNAAMAFGMLPLGSLHLGLVSYGGSSTLTLIGLLGVTAGIAMRGTDEERPWRARVACVRIAFLALVVLVAVRAAFVMLGA